MPEDLHSEIKDVKRDVEKRLRVYFSKALSRSSKIHPIASEIIRRLEEFTLRGSSKRVRALLVRLGYLSVSSSPGSSLTDVAAAVEIIHSYLLIHDDIIDRDDTRRGGPTVHRYFSDWHKRRLKGSDADHFGLSMGILAGNIGGYLAYELIIQSSFPETKKLEAIRHINLALTETNFGEALDVFQGYRGRSSAKDIYQIHTYKTAKYTFELPLQLGAILAGASQKDLLALSRYAIPAGLAFQIQDDILGVFGSPEQTGKPAHSDLREGKRTLLYTETRKRLSGPQLKRFDSLYGSATLSYRDAGFLRGLIRDCGALEANTRLARIHADRAKKALPQPGQKKNKSAILLRQLADFIVSRTS
ncbi:MAG: polyprenyl synthetase family protein [bacterium]|nr:polyprenyl synthetase family protein [bacterium]